MSSSLSLLRSFAWFALLPLMAAAAIAGEDWTQLKFDARHSGNAPDRHVQTPLGLLAAAPLTDAVFTAPVVADGRVYVVDGAGVAFCLDAAHAPRRVEGRDAAAAGNCNNVSSPALAGRYLHFGTMAGDVLRSRRGHRQGRPRDRLRRADLQHAGGRQRAGLFRHARLAGLCPHARRHDLLDMGLRQGEARLLRRPLERGRLGPSTSRAA